METGNCNKVATKQLKNNTISEKQEFDASNKFLEQFSESNSPQNQTIALEDIFDELGNPGLYSFSQIVLLFLGTCSIAYAALVFVFIGYQTPHRCAALVNETEVLNQYDLSNDTSSTFHYHKCTIDVWSNSSGHLEKMATMSCLNGNDYYGLKHISLVSEWDYVCEQRTGLVEFIQTVMMIGQMAGGVFTTTLADKLGRKPIYVLSNIGLVVIGVAAAYSPNIYVLIVMKFFTGVFQQGTGLVGFTLLMELLLPRHRRYVGTLAGTNWNLSVCLFALTGWLMKDMSWRNMQLVTGLVGINVVLNIFFLCESPRWLIANKKYDSALAILRRACKVNGKDFSKVKKIFEDNIRNVEEKNSKDDNTESSANQKYSVFDILRHKTLLKTSLIIWLTWITCSTTYYGLILTSSTLAGNRHLNFFLMTVVDFPGDVAIFTFIDRVGRRVLAMGSLFITGVGLLTASFLMAYGTSSLTATLTTVFFLVGKFGIGLCFSTVFLYTPELFPTNLRSAGMGMCSSVSRIGGMFAPYTMSLAEVVLWGPGAIFTALCFLSGVLCVKLPETKGRSLPTTIEEMKNWNKNGKSKNKKPLLDEEKAESLPNSNNGLKKRTNDL